MAANSPFFEKTPDGWIQTQALWGRKRPLCQLCHNNCPGTFTARLGGFVQFKMIQRRPDLSVLYVCLYIVFSLKLGLRLHLTCACLRLCELYV